MLTRIVDQSPIKLDQKKNMGGTMTISMKSGSAARISPFKLKQLETPEKLGKTFDLTQMTASLDTEPNSPIMRKMKLEHKSQKRYVSQTSREIIKASKQELMEQLTSPRESSLK